MSHLALRSARSVRLIAAFLLVAWSLPAAAAGPASSASAPPSQRGRITLEALYSPDPDERVDYDGSVTRGIEWVDEEYYAVPPGPGGQGWRRVEAATGAAVPAVDTEAVRSALTAIPGLSEQDVGTMAEAAAGDLARGTSPAIVNHLDDLFAVWADGRARRLTFDPAPEVGEDVSPDGRFVAFVRHHDMYLIDLENGRERALTDDGSEELLYGRLDWVYQEEIYGRGNFKGFWWSPDGSRLAYLKLDESPVMEFTVVDHLPDTLDTEVTNYPKAGTPNPQVSLGVVRAAGGDTVWVDTSRYDSIEHLIVDVDWTPDSERVVFQVQDREQRWLDLALAHPETGAMQAVLREETPAFVQVLGPPRWLDDDSFLWLSERSGYQHVYRFRLEGEVAAPGPLPSLRETEAAGGAHGGHGGGAGTPTLPASATLIRAVTDGEWEVRELHGVGDDGRIYFSANERSPIANDVYRVRLDGSGMERLSQRPGHHAPTFSPELSRYVDTWSDVHTPPQVRLHDADGTELRVVDGNPSAALRELELGEVEFLQVAARDGFPMEAMIIRPPDFDPSRQYPVLQYNYGGPHAPVVRNSWGGTRYLWHQMLAQQGYVIWMCDNRSASGKGIAPTWEAYERMGVVELRDIEDGVAWLKDQDWVDPDRLGIWGWSYGGFMAAYALTHSTSFRAGIAGAPVTDWRLYDTIYTERYMRTPQNNPEGYAATSVVEAAADLHGELFLVHGTMDDNVHLQNSIQLVHALQEAGKQFHFMVYPRSRHGVRDPELVYHLQREMTEFILDRL